MYSRKLVQLVESYHGLKGKAFAFYLKLVLQHFGEKTRVTPPLCLKYPDKIWVGDATEIRQGCGLYGRSNEEIGIKIGARCRIKEYCMLDAYSGHIFLGEQVLLGQASTIHGHGGVEIGDYTLIGPHVCIFSNNHIFDDVKRLIQSQGELWEKTTIGRNAWIGAGSIILAGVTVGDNSVIGAGAVVTRDIPPNSLAAGMPARVIKSLL